MGAIPAKFGSSFSRNGHAIKDAKRRLAARAMGATIVIALIALAASQQATSSPDTTADDSQNSSKSVKLDVVTDSTKSGNSSDIDNNISVDTNTTNNTSPGASASANTNMSVTVNGQSVEVPNSGTTRQTITTPGGSTTVNISNNTNAAGTEYNSSYYSLNQNASTYVRSSSFSSNVNQSFGGSP